MSNDEYVKVELPAIEQLKKLNWKYIHGNNLSPDYSNERKSLFCLFKWKTTFDSLPYSFWM